MRYLLSFIALCFFNITIAQEILTMDDVYTKDKLTYKTLNNQLFTGQVQWSNNNAYRNTTNLDIEFYDNGKKIKWETYSLNVDDERELKKEVEFYPELLKRKKITIYIDEGKECTLYDKKGDKIFEELYDANDFLIYRNEYKDEKKHGIHTYFEEGEKYQKEFKNGFIIRAISYKGGEKIKEVLLNYAESIYERKVIKIIEYKNGEIIKQTKCNIPQIDYVFDK
ncbi:hypothetical protein [Aquimarina rubra]|uniref:Toxin-antitoxin system YwqK family antitoxin n=1 Tax=Aquimarina rubra TaxID=1920033 RepID=A0ABW5LER3_9FLAO